jgi:hypothetical protein
MAGAIGAISVDIIRGLPADPKMRVETWLVPGVPGVGAMQLGMAGEDYPITTIKYCADSPTAIAHVAACELAQGTIVAVTDTWGTTFNGVLVKHVDTSDAKKAMIYLGATGVHVMINWTLIATGAS